MAVCRGIAWASRVQGVLAMAGMGPGAAQESFFLVSGQYRSKGDVHGSTAFLPGK